MELAIGLDMGGSHLKYGLVTGEGRAVLLRSRPSGRDQGLEGVRGALAQAAEELLGEAPRRGTLSGAGVGFPGIVNGSRGTVLTSPPQIPGVEGLHLASLLRKVAGVPAVADNDANMAGLAEARVGAGRGHAGVILVTVGTGVGGAVVLNGNLVRGRFGTAGEIGQTIFRPDLGPSEPGGPSRLEYHASATALLRIYRELGGSRRMEARQVVQEAREGRRRAQKALERVGRALGQGLASAALLLAPDRIVVGGGLSGAGRLLLDPVRAAFQEQVFPGTARGCRLVKARLGNKAGVVGAALAALDAAGSTNVTPGTP